MFYDPTYFLVIIAIVLTSAVQMYMTSTFSKYENVISKSGLTASKVASMILSSSGIDNVRIGRVAGNLTDHYAPLKKELNLSFYIKENAKYVLKRKSFFNDAFWPTLKLYNEKLYIPTRLYEIRNRISLKRKGVI